MRDEPVERATQDSPPYLTTREVADLLRVKERKIYDLAAAGGIPHRRVTGKLLFPAAEIQKWIEGGKDRQPRVRPAVLAGSHDPLLDWAVRDSGAALATLFNGSADGLRRFAEGRAAVAGIHLPDRQGWNVQSAEATGLTSCVLIAWAGRVRGLILSSEVQKDVHGVADLKGRRVVLRQPGAGGAAIFEELLAGAGLTSKDLVPAPGIARTESDAAAAVAAGEADAALGIEAMACQFRLPFLPLIEERFDLLVDRRAYFTEPLQTLFRFSRSESFRLKAAAMGGYRLTDLGMVRWLSP